MSMQSRRFLIGTLLVTAWILLSGSAHAAEWKAAESKGIAVESLPPAVQTTVREQTKGAVIHNISKEVEHGKTLYEVETKVGGRSRDMIIGADGKLMVVEAQVVMDSLPAPARETYMKHIGKGKIVALETVSLGDSLAYYEAQIEANGKRSELKVDPNGNVVTDKKKK